MQIAKQEAATGNPPKPSDQWALSRKEQGEGEDAHSKRKAKMKRKRKPAASSGSGEGEGDAEDAESERKTKRKAERKRSKPKSKPKSEPKSMAKSKAKSKAKRQGYSPEDFAGSDSDPPQWKVRQEHPDAFLELDRRMWPQGMETGKHSYTLKDPNFTSKIEVQVKNRCFYVVGALPENVHPLTANASGGVSVGWPRDGTLSIAMRLALLVAGWPSNWPDVPL